jgi:hypothetical protein
MKCGGELDWPLLCTTPTSAVLAWTLSFLATSTLQRALLTRLALELDPLSLRVMVTFCGQDGSVSEHLLQLSEVSRATTGERLGT